jgi:hypothetical protein
MLQRYHTYLGSVQNVSKMLTLEHFKQYEALMNNLPPGGTRISPDLYHDLMLTLAVKQL